MAKKQKVLIIVGPTSSGKSALAVELARKFNGEVISADSRQVYRGLDIGTGKITKREMNGVPHHLLDVASPKRQFTANDFVEKSYSAIASILRKGKLPIIAGGTGFYIDALVGRIALPNVPPNAKLRAQLEKKSTTQLFAMLKKCDPRRAKTMSSPSERNNKVRLIRALEVTTAIGKVPMFDLRNRTYDTLWIGIAPPMKQLEQKITIRLFGRIRGIRGGMIAEAKRLHSKGLSYKRMEELGLEYRSLARLLQGKITHEEMVVELSHAIRRYAIRQMHYWKRNKDIQWFKDTRTVGISKTVKVWLEKN